MLCDIIDKISVGLSSGKAEDVRGIEGWMPQDWEAPPKGKAETPDLGAQLRAWGEALNAKQRR